MTAEPSRYPLSWPALMPRAKSREKGAFRTELAGALKNVEQSLVMFGRDSGKQVDNIVLSSNVTLGHGRPEDPGVAAWFLWDGLQVCIPVDRYDTVAANLQAIHHIIEARRTELRHGTLALVRASFQGFVALPAPVAPWKVLGVGPRATAEEIRAAWLKKVADTHPDRQGGSEQKLIEVNEARDAMMRGLSQC